MDAEILLNVKRGSLTEREHYGYICITDKNGIETFSAGNTNRPFFLRSCAKPFQALPIVQTGTEKAFNLTSEELALCCASHTGTATHTQHVSNILKKAGLNETYLKCGSHMPIDENTMFELVKNNEKARPEHNNCSGKHAGMLSVCAFMDYDTESYLKNEHPLQKQIVSIIEDLCEEKSKDIQPDGCGTPIPAVGLKSMCKGFSKLMIQNPMIADSMRHNPYLAGGHGRIDSEVMNASKGRLIAKLGAEGLCLVFNTETGETIGVKILDSNTEARSICVIESLIQKQWLKEDELKNPAILKLFDTQIKTRSGKTVGEIERLFSIK